MIDIINYKLYYIILLLFEILFIFLFNLLIFFVYVILELDII